MRGTRHWWSSCTTPHSTPGGHPTLHSTALKSHSQGDCFFPPHFSVSHGSPGNLLGEGISSAPTLPDRVGQSTICPSLAVWQVSNPEGHDLLAGQILDFVVTGLLE